MSWKESLRSITMGDMLDEAIRDHPDTEAIVYVDGIFALHTANLGPLWTAWPRD